MDYAVEMLGISKYFPSTEVQANQNVDFQIRKGEIHSLVGENGAGKTTLMNILYGLHLPDSGKIIVSGKEAKIINPLSAIRCGINMVHQHFKLIPSFTVAENILLGAEPDSFGLLKPKQEVQTIASLAETFGLSIDPNAKVRDLPVGLQQRVEILKALYRKAQVLLLDEPTAVLTPQESRELFDVIRKLSAQGCTVVFITHKLPEVMEVADRVTVMRQGQVIDTVPISSTNMADLARKMVGRDVLFRVKKGQTEPGQVRLKVNNVAVAGNGGIPAVLDVSFDVREKEIVGIAGVNGNGQSELVEAITGMRPTEMGEIFLDDRNITHLPIGKRRVLGIAHIPEDRMSTGLNLQTIIDENLIGIRYYSAQFSRLGFFLKNKIHAFTQKIIRDFSVAAAHPGEEISTLSGGNLQKIVIGRELASQPRTLIAHEPTRGLDVGSIEFVHKTLIDARDNGAAILLVSVDLDEIRSLSDRILVMYRGKIAGQLRGPEVTEENLGILMGGGRLEMTEEPFHA